ncbi:hypothetical protein [Streptomyces atratus]
MEFTDIGLVVPPLPLSDRARNGHAGLGIPLVPLSIFAFFRSVMGA